MWPDDLLVRAQAGTTTVRYGSMRENVLALTAVLASGEIIHTGRETRKFSAGYDLTRLLIGSEGTLAVITELSLRVFRIPEKMAAATVRFSSLSQGVRAATEIVKAGISIARYGFSGRSETRFSWLYELNIGARGLLSC